MEQKLKRKKIVVVGAVASASTTTENSVTDSPELILKVKAKTPSQVFKAEIKRIINENVHFKGEDSQFPRLPKIFKVVRNKSSEITGYNLEELKLTAKKGKKTKAVNRAHTLSVLSGYKSRVKNYHSL